MFRTFVALCAAATLCSPLVASAQTVKPPKKIEIRVNDTDYPEWPEAIARVFGTMLKTKVGVGYYSLEDRVPDGSFLQLDFEARVGPARAMSEREPVAYLGEGINPAENFL